MTDGKRGETPLKNTIGKRKRNKDIAKKNKARRQEKNIGDLSQQDEQPCAKNNGGYRKIKRDRQIQRPNMKAGALPPGAGRGKKQGHHGGDDA